MKSGNLNFLEPSVPLQACNGTVLPFFKQEKRVKRKNRIFRPVTPRKGLFKWTFSPHWNIKMYHPTSYKVWWIEGAEMGFKFGPSINVVCDVNLAGHSNEGWELNEGTEWTIHHVERGCDASHTHPHTRRDRDRRTLAHTLTTATNVETFSPHSFRY